MYVGRNNYCHVENVQGDILIYYFTSTTVLQLVDSWTLLPFVQ